MKTRLLSNAVASLAVMTLFGCGGGGGGAPAAAPAPPPGSTTITGSVVKGPVNGSSISLFDVKADGTVDRTKSLGTGTTKADGSYTITLTGTPSSGPIVIEATGGTYTDEASKTAGVNLKATMRTAVSTVADGDSIAVTPLTEMAYKKTEGLGQGASALGAFVKANIDDSNLKIGQTWSVDNIVKSHPFDATGSAPTGASTDDKKYAGALLVFSQMVNDNKGAASLDDALGTYLVQLETELHDKGGYSNTTVTALNAAITECSSKNTGGTPPPPVVFKGGVLTLKTTGTLAAGVAINGIDFTLTLPAGVTVKADAITGEATAGVVQPSSLAASNSIATAKYTPVGGTVTQATLHIVLLNVQPGFALGEFMHINFDGFPSSTGQFTYVINQVSGGSDPKVTPTTLTGVTIPAITAADYSGL